VVRQEFEKKLPMWVGKVQEAGTYDCNAQPIDPQRDKYLAKYILKGTDPDFVDHFFLQAVHKPQGTIWGQRARVSAALDRATRERAGWAPPRRIRRRSIGRLWRSVNHTPGPHE
jgi:hypothetical protein